ncbi:MAG: radical SAM protein [Thermoplasmatota archaeon]
MKLRISEIFASFQGEGKRTGVPTVFVRLAGCNLDCSWCDTEYAKDPGTGYDLELSEIESRIMSFGLKAVCITGGEPLLQENVKHLISNLTQAGYYVDIETNGSICITSYRGMSDRMTFSLDVKLPSSGHWGSFDPRNLENLTSEDQLKFVVYDMKDLHHAFSFMKQHEPECDLIISPVNNEFGDKIADGLMELIRTTELGTKDHLLLRIRLMVQTHKVIWGADKKGV